MFAKAYFCLRHFARRFFPKVGAQTVVRVRTGGTWTLPARSDGGWVQRAAGGTWTQPARTGGDWLYPPAG